VNEQSATRRELEASIRALVPSRDALPSLEAGEQSTLASVGVGAIITGYLWGRIRGRQVRKRKRR
jgi:hypothetical protein